MSFFKPKIIEGHTFSEYKNKYGNYLSKHPKAHVIGKNNPKLKSFRKYWKIDEDYYLLPMDKKIIIPIGATGGVAAVATTTLVIGATVGGWFNPSKPTPTPPIGNKVKITFDAKDKGEFKDLELNGITTKVIEVDKGTTWANVANKPVPTPKSSDDQFDYYTINNEKINDNYVFNVDTTVGATYTAKKIVTVSVTFDPNGGEFPSKNNETKVITVKKDSKWGDITKPSDPIKENAVFKFWSQDGKSEIKSDFTISSDLTVKAVYEDSVVTITFDSNGGEFTPETNATKEITVKKGSKWSEINKPKDPVKQDAEFKFWSKDGKNEIDSNYEINENLEVKAIYEDTTVTVTFDSNGGEFPAEANATKEIKIKKGSKWSDISKPSNPKKTKFIFKFWTINDKAIDSSFVINENLTVKAFYNDVFTVKFDADGGTFTANNETKEIEVEKGTKWKDIKNKPNNPTKAKDKEKFESYEFECWKINNSKIDDGYEINKDTEVKASYKVILFDGFEDASWYEIVTTAEESGFKGLVDKYRKGVDNPTFVGKEKTVKVNEGTKVKDYKVKVIDEQADELNVDKTVANNHAVLTFEFEEVLNIDDVEFNKTNIDDVEFNKISNKWKESTLRTSLNDDKDKDSIFNKIVEPLDDGDHKNELLTGRMIETKKKTNSSGGNPTMDKLFLPSLSELGVKYIPNSNPQVQVDDEGIVYKNYNNNQEDEEKSFIKVKDNESHGYWLRSDDADVDGKVWYVGDDGKIDESKVSTEKLGVSPCFCIGKTSNAVSVTYSLGDDSLIKFSDGTTEPKSFTATKNTTYTAFKKGITVPTVTKESTDDNDFEFKCWYYYVGDSKVEISEDYLLQDYNLILYPEFETKPKDYKPGITLELLNVGTEDEPTYNPVNVTFETKITDTDKQPKLYYSTDDGKNYTKVEWGGTSPKTTKVTINSNNPKLTISSNTDDNSTYGLSHGDGNTSYTQIKVDEDKTTKGGRVSLSGDLRTLIKADSYQTLTKATDFCFYDLFGGDASGEGPTTLNESHNGIQDASNLVLGFSETGTKSFQKMFMASISMKKGPKSLGPTKIGYGAYWNMFNSCRSLTEAPSLADISDLSGTYQYYKMFLGCTALETGPKLYATKLGTWSYGSMFKYCTSLKYAPELPDGMEFVEGTNRQLCGMFSGCSALLTAPKKLSANKIYEASYQNMFENCALLENGPEIYATEFATLESGKDKHMSSMFSGCKKLNYVKIYFDISLYKEYTSKWMYGVTTLATSIFECPTLTTSVTRGEDGIPKNWTIKTF